jgi:hypothetical protein
MNVLQIETMIYQNDQDDNIHNLDKKNLIIMIQIFKEKVLQDLLQQQQFMAGFQIFFHMEEFIWLICVNLFGQLDHPFQMDKNLNCNKKK